MMMSFMYTYTKTIEEDDAKFYITRMCGSTDTARVAGKGTLNPKT